MHVDKQQHDNTEAVILSRQPSQNTDHTYLAMVVL